MLALNPTAIPESIRLLLVKSDMEERRLLINRLTVIEDRLELIDAPIKRRFTMRQSPISAASKDVDYVKEKANCT